ncbi:glycosyltransferase family 4 protein [Sphingosinicella sp. BN140058]|uniref:glycosyltransferase family 4 protein n=1 Tax=Sphingosinicella sp. BN140058 TaxID=1892855 RepID=UPI001011C621|nr:glycosyltransferase family 4 protein [Sphingosinicella sp. BN140058]QAY77038.1 glycosyltransferase [Sphingosinicella sp. BN140058]
MTRTLRAAFIANGNPRDIKLWSGTPHHMLKALERQFDVTLVVEQVWADWYRPLGRAAKLLTGGRFEYSWSRFYSRLAAARTIRKLEAARPDVVFAVALTDAAYLFTERLPVVTITDAVIPDLVEYYDMFRQLSVTAKRKARAAEHRAFHESLLVHFPSHWACRSAIEKQGMPAEQVVQIAWGANMPPERRLPRRLGGGPVRLLFVGTDWKRKGGPVALSAVRALAERGIQSSLDIVGCSEEVLEGASPLPNVTFHGFIDKSSPADQATLNRLYSEASFFILPTAAEAWGIVFAEAAHHGLPSLGYATGGVTTVVSDGETGILLPVGSSGDTFASHIEALLNHPDAYERMSAAALEDAANRLDWQVWAAKLERVVRQRLDLGRSPI